MEFLTGKDYPHLCQTCRDTITAIAICLDEGEDTDNEEAPCDFVYDHAMLCGGRECINRPTPQSATTFYPTNPNHGYA